MFNFCQRPIKKRIEDLIKSEKESFMRNCMESVDERAEPLLFRECHVEFVLKNLNNLSSGYMVSVSLYASAHIKMKNEALGMCRYVGIGVQGGESPPPNQLTQMSGNLLTFGRS